MPSISKLALSIADNSFQAEVFTEIAMRTKRKGTVPRRDFGRSICPHDPLYVQATRPLTARGRSQIAENRSDI
jgi:hypothetical protein